MPDRPRVRLAAAAVFAVFAANGVVFASWLSRLPAVRDDLDLSPQGLGLVLLALSTGAVLALPSAGVLTRRFGPARTVAVGGAAAAVGATLVGLAPGWHSLAVALFLLGLATGAWDVAQNVEAADVEQRLGITLMPRFHGAFSLGTVAGALGGAGVSYLGVARGPHLAVVAGLTLVVVLVAVTRFLPGAPARTVGAASGEVGEVGAGTDAAATGRRFGVLDAWREPRTLLLGVMVLGFALVEGIANDWLHIAVIDSRGVENWVGSAVLGVFLTGMTVGRMFGHHVVDALGVPVTVRATAALAAAGSLVVVLVPGVTGAVVGALLWGAGAALGFPLGMTAAAHDPVRASLRVSVVSSIGYTAFLAGPPLVGLLGERFGVDVALLVVPLAALVAVVASGALGRTAVDRAPAEEPREPARTP